MAFGRDNGISDWVRSGYIALATRNAPLSGHEFEVLGLKSALVVSQKVRRWYREHYLTSSQGLTWSGVDGESVDQVIDGVFEHELLEHTTGGRGLVEEILLARTQNASGLLRAGYVQLARRTQDITIEEAERLGLESSARICQVRERFSTPSGKQRLMLCQLVTHVAVLFDQPAGSASIVSRE